MMQQADRVFEAELRHAVAMPYLEFRPAGDTPPAGWPLILFLHGASEKGADGSALRRAVLPAMIERGWEVNAVVVCPQCPPGPGWPIADLSAFLDRMIARDDINAAAVHLTGISMGGRGAWELAYVRASGLATIAPVCGFGIPNLAPVVAGVPAWLFHGSDDDVLPVARSAEMAAALDQAGGDVRFSPLAGQPHDCGEAVYGNPELWRWMLDHRRGTRLRIEPA